ncbi:uncharacterized protein LOC123322767 isoform X1 [Coccinella septempunctata]|uniref:uncharacterized protein LOC123322767 isoform X1 n=1 Tax=Coccinella septempunctata TaxID=41139 RepID=UPI001D099882|nr:uncharacterized protein LOC123322767 isoform X1 [Coccinella septempunctata]
MQKDISSSRDTSPNPVSGRVSWIYELNKQELTDELRKLGENVSDSESFEILRRLLIKKWRHLHAGADNVSDSGTEREKHSVPSKLSVRASVRAIMTDNKISFTLNKDNWDVFIERLELYFETQDIDEKKYSAELLTRVCQETYIIFRNLVAPKKTKEFKFGELVKLMKTHLNPTPSEISERNKFYNIKQYPSESISEFVSRLKENSLHCNFKEIETALRDQFVCGLLQPETKIELFRQENLTFQSAVAIAEARESAVKNSLSLKKEETIHFVEKKGFKKHNNFNNKADRNSREREMGQRQFHPERERDGASRRYGDGANREHEDRRGRQNESSVRRRSSGTNGNRSSNVQVTSKNVTCYCCGKRNHFAKDCRYRYKSCNYCHTKGHLENACFKKNLVPYQPGIQLVIACDASSTGLSSILSHKFANGEERPIAYASKIIPKNELHRSILDKEAAAIVFGFRKFYHYLIGNEVILRTDNQPLKYIFGETKNISSIVHNRLIRWSYFLAGFKYKIELISTKRNGNCDALSRLPVADDTRVFDSELGVLNFLGKDCQLINLKVIQRETQKDKILISVKRKLTLGWPDDVSKLSEEERKYFDKRIELGVEKDCIVKGVRVVIPDCLRKAVLAKLHESHFGVVRMKQVARSYFWWPEIDCDIENLANTCKICVSNSKRPEKISFMKWPYPTNVWSRLHADFLGPFFGRMFLIIIDAHSKWPEVCDMGTVTTSERTIEKFETLFSRYGICDHLVTDNGPQFTSFEFKRFLESVDVNHSFSPPYHPATNGAAENFVQTFKDKVNKIVSSGKTLRAAINLFLFDYRTMFHPVTGISPAEIMFQRPIKSRFNLFTSKLTDEVCKKQWNLVEKEGKHRKYDFKVGDIVMTEVLGNKKKNVKLEGKIIRKLTPVTFHIELKTNGQIIKRHVNQFIKLYNGLNIENCEDKNKADLLIRRSERLKMQNNTN